MSLLHRSLLQCSYCRYYFRPATNHHNTFQAFTRRLHYAQAGQAVPPIFTRSIMGISGPIIACYFPNLGRLSRPRASRGHGDDGLTSGRSSTTCAPSRPPGPPGSDRRSAGGTRRPPGPVPPPGGTGQRLWAADRRRRPCFQSRDMPHEGHRNPWTSRVVLSGISSVGSLILWIS